MVLTPSDLFSWKKGTKVRMKLSNNVYKMFLLDQKTAHSACADPPPSCPLKCSSSSFPMLSLPLLGINCLPLPLSGGAGQPSLPSPYTDPIFLWSQAPARFHIRHTNPGRFLLLSLESRKCNTSHLPIIPGAYLVVSGKSITFNQ
jgi:hypothetical protein